MEKLNVKCSACNEGNLVVKELIHDDYKMGCTDCDSSFTVHYTGFDSIMEEHDYYEQISEDVKILNDNGKWSRTHDSQFAPKDFNMADFTKGMKHIQTIDSYMLYHYYQEGGNFYQIQENQIHKTFEIYKYQMKESSFSILVEHFFGIKA